MNEILKIINTDDAIKILENYNREKVILCTVDFDRGTSIQNVIGASDGIKYVKAAKTVIYESDPLLPHMLLHSKIIKNIKDIERIGVIIDIIFGSMSGWNSDG